MLMSSTPTTAIGLLILLASASFAFHKALRYYLVHKYTVVHDLKALGTPRTSAKIPGNAVICGGSMAGLFAARVCSDHFERVVVIEPESWTFTPEARSPAAFATRQVSRNGVTYDTIQHRRSRLEQYSAVHIYQVVLLRFARKIFPGFDSVAESWGLMISPADLYCFVGGWSVPSPWQEYGGKLPATIVSTRRDLEPLFRSLVRDSCPNVHFVNGTVTKFTIPADESSIRSVSVRRVDGTTVEVSAALVADCTGRSQTGLKLLARAIPSFQPKKLREEYDPATAYSTLEFPIPPKFDERVRAMEIRNLCTEMGLYDTDRCSHLFLYNPDPRDDCRMISVARRDKHGLVMCFGGWDTELPVSLDEARAFVGKVKNASHIPNFVRDILDLCEPVANRVVAYPTRVSWCWNIRYERASKELPCNFVALGDASMRVNPRYGQGVTKCAIGAVTLDAVLRQLLPWNKRFGRSFFALMHPRTENMWDTARFADYDNPSTVPVGGETHETGRFMRWYRSKLLPILSKSPEAASSMYHVLHFLAPPTDVFAPRVLLSVLGEILYPSRRGSGQSALTGPCT